MPGCGCLDDDGDYDGYCECGHDCANPDEKHDNDHHDGDLGERYAGDYDGGSEGGGDMN